MDPTTKNNKDFSIESKETDRVQFKVRNNTHQQSQRMGSPQIDQYSTFQHTGAQNTSIRVNQAHIHTTHVTRGQKYSPYEDQAQQFDPYNQKPVQNNGQIRQKDAGVNGSDDAFRAEFENINEPLRQIYLSYVEFMEVVRALHHNYKRFPSKSRKNAKFESLPEKRNSEETGGNLGPGDNYEEILGSVLEDYCSEVITINEKYIETIAQIQKSMLSSEDHKTQFVGDFCNDADQIHQGIQELRESPFIDPSLVRKGFVLEISAMIKELFPSEIQGDFDVDGDGKKGSGSTSGHQMPIGSDEDDSGSIFFNSPSSRLLGQNYYQGGVGRPENDRNVANGVNSPRGTKKLGICLNLFFRFSVQQTACGVPKPS